MSSTIDEENYESCYVCGEYNCNPLEPSSYVMCAFLYSPHRTIWRPECVCLPCYRLMRVHPFNLRRHNTSYGYPGVLVETETTRIYSPAVYRADGTYELMEEDDDGYYNFLPSELR
jgi:hypothetical protein